MSFSSISVTWNKWNTRGFVLLSLSLQVFLVLFAPLRKKTANRLIISSLWLAYLMADWVAAFTIGLISHNQGNSSAQATEVDGALQAFWASFLLLHLGGPDTITAFSLEDSSLWRRHLLNLIFQIGAAVYVFVKLFPSDVSLMIPTLLVFISGLIKNVERTLALILSILLRLKVSVLSPHRLVGELDERWDRGDKFLEQELNVLGIGYPNTEAKLPESIVVKHAYYFFQIFKIFLGDFMFTRQNREISREYFRKVSAMDGLRLISVELNFIYEVLHTKVLAIRSKRSYLCRSIALSSVVMAFVLFNRLKKYHQISKLDEEITYSLLFGGIALEVIALFMLVFSDWTIAEIKCYNTGSSKLDSFLRKFVAATDGFKKPRFATCKAEANADVTYTVLDTPLIFQRWSESISACNFFSEFLKESPRKMYTHNRGRSIIPFSNIHNFPIRMTKKIISCFYQAIETIARDWGAGFCNCWGILMIADTKYVSKNPFVKKLWIFIFSEVRRKSESADNPTEVIEIFEARGDLFLKSMSEEINCDNLLHYTTVNYDSSIIIWHLATEIWYNKEKCSAINDEREFSKILSDYMFYLLVNQPNVVSAVAGTAQLISREMLNELQNYIVDASRGVEGLCEQLDEFTSDIRETLLHEGIDLAPGMERPETKKEKPKIEEGLLLEVINLVREMESLEEKKWKVMSGVWVQILSYAASHIKGEAHVQVLSKGGELLTFVWLLMAHFGCFYKPGWGIYYDRRFYMYRPANKSNRFLA